MTDVVRDIEEAFVAHWALLGQWPGARLIDEDGVLRFETPIRKLPYNGVIRTEISGRADDVVPRVVDAYAGRGAKVMWVVHPSAAPDDLAERLEAAGLAPVERAVGMALELDSWSAAGGSPTAEFTEVVDEEGLQAYVDVSMSYWELDEADRNKVAQLNRHWSGPRARGRRWLASLDGQVVGKGYVSLAGPPGVAAIYGMSVLPEARGHGVASGLTDVLLAQAKEAACRRAVLHSSEMAVGLYRRAGFVERCTFRIFATAPIWSGRH